jgi:hypothetical protein
MDRSFFPDGIQAQLGETILKQIHKTILAGGVNLKFLSLFESCWIDPEQLFLKAIIPITDRIRQHQGQEVSQAVGNFLARYADGQLNMDVALHVDE